MKRLRHHEAPRATAIVLALVGVALAGGCGGGPIDLGADPDFVWFSDHESVDAAGGVGDWLSKGEPGQGFVYVTGGGEIAIVEGPARSGRRALRSLLTGQGPSAMGAAQVRRNEGVTGAAYYGAWFMVPEPVQPQNYWVFLKLRWRDGEAQGELWDLKLAPNPAGEMVLQLFQHASGLDVTPVATVPVPLGRWFQVEVFFLPANDSTGTLKIWQDGTVVYDVVGQATTPSPMVEWVLGSLSDALSPSAVTLYIDDAFVSRRRLGPTFPIFWRP